MKRLMKAAALAVALAAGGLIAPAAAYTETGQSVSFNYFHAQLSPHGQWFSHPRYGRSWRPHGVAADWRPYTNGRWVWTDEHGWMWASYYDWGWATFHYGRWAHDIDYGWYWVPGYTWGPAWVAWRQGDGFIGWYALPPEAAWNPAVGIAYHGAGIYGYRTTPYWVFVPERYFASPRIHSVVVRARDNRRFIRNTHRKTRYRRVRNRVFNHGIDRRYVARVTHKRIAAVKPRVTTRRGAWRRHAPGRKAVRIFRPPVVERGHRAGRARAAQQRRVHRRTPRQAHRNTHGRVNRGARQLVTPRFHRGVPQRAQPQVRQRNRPNVRRRIHRQTPRHAHRNTHRRVNRSARQPVTPRFHRGVPQRAKPRLQRGNRRAAPQRAQPRRQHRARRGVPQQVRRGNQVRRPSRAVRRGNQVRRPSRAVRRGNQVRRPSRAVRRAAPRRQKRQAQQHRRRVQAQENNRGRGAQRGGGARRGGVTRVYR